MHVFSYISLVALSLSGLMPGSAISPVTQLPDSLQSNSLPAIRGVEAYVDPDFGFSMAVPTGWRLIVAAESEEDLEELEPGYAVGFESPRSSVADRFADYIMVEILPGPASGAFETSGEHRHITRIDGQSAIRDRLALPDYNLQGTAINLIVYQAELVEVGYTIGFYAIGESNEEKALHEAFEVMIRTFKRPTEPFSVT